MRTIGDIKYFRGDKVYYMRRTKNKWQGPAVVLGQDGQQVLVKHGGIYIRVHPCRLKLEEYPSHEKIKTNYNEYSEKPIIVLVKQVILIPILQAIVKLVIVKRKNIRVMISIEEMRQL